MPSLVLDRLRSSNAQSRHVSKGRRGWYNAPMLFDLNLVQYVRQNGLRAGCQQILDQIGISLDQEGSLPTQGPLLVIANHAGMPDTFVVMATANRDDLFQVALAGYQEMLIALDLEVHKHFIPIYRPATYRDSIIRLIFGKKYTYQSENEHVTSAQNKESINKAATLLETGNTVSIFPQGSVGKATTQTGWRAGVGYLVKRIKNDDMRVVFVYIRGTNRMDIFRFLKPVRSLFKNKKVTVRYSEPLTLSALGVDVSKSGKEIAKQIERKYYEEAKEYL